MSDPIQSNLTPPRNYKTIKLWKGIVVLLGCALIVFGIGNFVGYKYFWNQFDETPLLEKQYQSAMEKVQQNPNSAENHVDFGWALFQKGQYNEALAEYKKATELDENNFRAYLNLAIAYRQVEKTDIAISTFQKAIELNPKSHEAHYYLGLTYQTNEKYDLALEELELADRLNPGSTQIIFDIGQVREKLGRIDQAKNDYISALQYDPNFTKAQEALNRLGGK